MLIFFFFLIVDLILYVILYLSTRDYPLLRTCPSFLGDLHTLIQTRTTTWFQPLGPNDPGILPGLKVLTNLSPSPRPPTSLVSHRVSRSSFIKTYVLKLFLKNF